MKDVYIAPLLAVGLLLFICFLIGLAGLANINIQSTITGNHVKSFDARSFSDTESSTALAKNVESLDYKYDSNWGKQSNGESGKSADITYTIVGAKGGYQNQLDIQVAGHGLKHQYRATGITGDFEGAGNSIILNTGVPAFDSLILMHGNATFRGRIIDGMTGRPITMWKNDMTGNMTVESWANMSVTQKPNTTEDWLAFCAQTYHDVIISPDSTGYYIEPWGYMMDKNGMLIRNMTMWQMNASSKVLELKVIYRGV